MYTLDLANAESKNLPKRTVRVLVGGASPLQSDRITFGVATVKPRTTMDPHTHETEEEIIYVLSGSGFVDMEGAKEEVKEGTVIQVPIGKSHSMSNQSDEEMNFIFCFNPPVVLGSYDKKS
jgi:quercetin dioxygenase-like cupin family protein